MITEKTPDGTRQVHYISPQSYVDLIGRTPLLHYVANVDRGNRNPDRLTEGNLRDRAKLFLRRAKSEGYPTIERLALGRPIWFKDMEILCHMDRLPSRPQHMPLTHGVGTTKFGNTGRMVQTGASETDSSIPTEQHPEFQQMRRRINEAKATVEATGQGKGTPDSAQGERPVQTGAPPAKRSNAEIWEDVNRELQTPPPKRPNTGERPQPYQDPKGAGKGKWVERPPSSPPPNARWQDWRSHDWRNQDWWNRRQW